MNHTGKGVGARVQSVLLTGAAGFALILCVMAGLPRGVTGTPSGTVSGIVIDERGPVSGASVRVQGESSSVFTDAAGNFTITGINPARIIAVSAWKDGYYCSVARNIISPATGVRLTLVAYQINDNSKYEWIPPEGKEEKESCAKCHNPVIIEMSLRDAHLNSASNPRFLSMYYGTDTKGNRSPLTRYEKGKTVSAWTNMLVPLPPDSSKPYFGPGYQLDFPGTIGDCTSCHVPGASVRGNVDPTTVKGADRYGVHCDFCHKVANVHLQETTGMPFPRRPGVQAMDVRRPFPEDPRRFQLFFGTFEDDNVPEEDTNLPLLKESRYCAACHFGVFWTTLVYNSYGEWLASPYSDPKSGTARTCQECHMPSPTVWKGKTVTNVAPGKGGIERNPRSIHSHHMTVDETLLKNSLTMTVEPRSTRGKVSVNVTLFNDKTGHHIPTDSPIRHLILLVNARDSQGNRLKQLEGPTLPEWCGTGDPAKGYYAGLPGKAYAKLLKELWTDAFPTGAYWNHTEVVSDNRLAAFAKDESIYVFAKPASGSAIITVRLLYRRAFKNIMDWKSWDVPDTLMTQQKLRLKK